MTNTQNRHTYFRHLFNPHWVTMLSTLRRTLFALLACASFIVHAAAPDEITTA